MLCSNELETALNVCWFHLDQLTSYIKPQIFQGGIFPTSYLPVQIYYVDPLPLSSFYGDKSTQFMIQPSFFKLLYKFINSNQRIFSYSQICGFFSSIIRHERNRLFDLRNILVANLQNHPFQQVFNVKAFHRKQIKQLLFKQLVFSQLSDLCAYKISKIVPYKDISKLQIPISLKCKISSMCKNKD